MELVRDLRKIPSKFREGALTIGNFDGVHCGHAALIRRLKRHARALHAAAVVFTFEPHPVRLLRPELAPPPLTWTERKAELLGQLGVDCVVAYPTDRDLLSLSPEEFFDRVIVQGLAARAVVEGPNFFFGKDRRGDINTLSQLCRSRGCEFEVVEPQTEGGDIISSSRLRDLLAKGDVDTARTWLSQPYRIRGIVTHGAHRGRTIGFPTANLDGVETLIPGVGVYAGWAYVQESRWPAALNVGPNPTFGEQHRKLEIHLIGFDGSLYGEPLEVDFLSRLRDIQTFTGVEDLRRQLQADVVAAADRCRDLADA